MPATAPSFITACRLWSLLEVAMTFAPNAVAICTAKMETPPVQVFIEWLHTHFPQLHAAWLEQ